MAHPLLSHGGMAPRAMWKGAISFGLVTVPINLVSATEARETLAFNLLHKKDGSRIVERRFCRDGLRDTGRLAVGTIVLRQREHLAALEPVGDALVLTTMRFAHEIRRQQDLDLPPSGKGWTDKEMKLTPKDDASGRERERREALSQ